MVSFFNIKNFKSRKKVMESFFSINPNLGGLFRGLLWGGGGGAPKITPTPVWNSLELC